MSILSICVLVGGLLSADTAEPPFPEALDRAAIRMNTLESIVEHGLLLGNGDLNALVHAENSDLVVRITKNGRPQTIRARDMLASLASELVGVVVNGVTEDRNRAYSYGYASRYGYRYHYDRYRYGNAYGKYGYGYGYAYTARGEKKKSARRRRKESRLLLVTSPLKKHASDPSTDPDAV